MSAQTRAFLNFNSGFAESKGKSGVKSFKDAGSKKVTPAYNISKLSSSKPKTKPKAKPKPVAKKAVASTPMSLFGASKSKPLAKKSAPKPVARKPMVSSKPKSKPVMAMKTTTTRRMRSSGGSKSGGMSLKETADLGFVGIIAGSFLLSLAILPGIADVALEAIGIAYTLYFTYNYLLFEESREEFRNTLQEFAASTGIDVPALFDSAIGAVSSVTDKVSSSGKKTTYPKKDIVVPVGGDPVSTELEPTE